MTGRLQIFTGTANRPLAEGICAALGVPLGDAVVGRYRNGETHVLINDSVRGGDVYVVQPTCNPVNEHLMELLIMLDALRRASAARITAVIPYYGYAKQEKKTAPREPISAKLVANLLVEAGANRLLTCDLHAPAIEGFFDIPVDHLQARMLLAAHLRALDLPRPVLVAPDAGRVGWAMEFRAVIGGELAIIAKHHPGVDHTEMIEMVGDVAGRTAILIEDMILTGSTLIAAASVLRSRGARAVYACATHAAFADGVRARLESSPLTRLLITDTVPLSGPAPEGVASKIEVLSVAPLLAEAIGRIHDNRSMSSLFQSEQHAL
ncbi:MAG TPA: ribose-phosphate pyrophosphokinase [Chloroflexia bacterium]|nr:ribose-phosphate pyrophosphokinase [Chloroflexia bacterium]